MNSFSKSAFGAIAILLIAFLSSGTVFADDIVYVRAGHLIDVQSGKLLKNQVITVRGDRIEKCCKRG